MANGKIFVRIYFGEIGKRRGNWVGKIGEMRNLQKSFGLGLTIQLCVCTFLIKAVYLL